MSENSKSESGHLIIIAVFIILFLSPAILPVWLVGWLVADFSFEKAVYFAISSVWCWLWAGACWAFLFGLARQWVMVVGAIAVSVIGAFAALQIPATFPHEYTNPDRLVKNGRNPDGLAEIGRNSGEGYYEKPIQIAYSPDGSLIAIGNAKSPFGDLALVNPNTRKRRILQKDTDTIEAVAFSQDGMFLVSGGGNTEKPGTGLIKIWDVASGRVLKSIETDAAVGSVAFAPDKSSVVSVSGQGSRQIKLWDVSTGALRSILLESRGFVYSARYSPDGGSIATAESHEGQLQVVLWDATTAHKRLVLNPGKGYSHGSECLAFSHDGRLIAFAFQGTAWVDPLTIKIWETNSGRAQATLVRANVRPGWQFSLAFSPDDKMLAACYEKDMHDNLGRQSGVILWDVATWRGSELYWYEERYENRFYLYTLAFSPDGQTLAVGGKLHDLGRIWLWDVNKATKRAAQQR